MKTLKLIQNINELKYLRNLYEKESLDTRHGYYTLTNFVRWFELNPRLDFVKVYVVEKTWRVNGFYIIEVSEVTVGLSRFLASPYSLRVTCRSNKGSVPIVHQLCEMRRGRGLGSSQVFELESPVQDYRPAVRTP